MPMHVLSYPLSRRSPIRQSGVDDVTLDPNVQNDYLIESHSMNSLPQIIKQSIAELIASYRAKSRTSTSRGDNLSILVVSIQLCGEA